MSETIIQNAPDTIWITNDEDPNGELKVSMKLPDGTIILPMQRIINRLGY